MRFLSLSFILISCHASSQITLEQFAKREFDGQFSISKNTSQTFALILKKELQGTTSYTLVQLSDLKILLKKTKIKAQVAWSGDMQIKETTIPGTLKKVESLANGIKIINVSDYLPKIK